MLAEDCIGTRRVDDVDFAERIHGGLDDVHVPARGDVSEGLAPREHLDSSGRGRGALFDQFLACQRVDEGALAGVELADDDDEKELVEAARRFRQGVLPSCLDVEPGEKPLQPGHRIAHFPQQGLMIRRQYAGQHASF